MSDSNKNTGVSTFNTHEPGWVNIDLESRNVEPELHRAEATVVDSRPGWTKLDLETQPPPKKRWYSYGLKTKIVVGTALIAMVVIGIAVPMVVTIKSDGRKGIQ